MAFDMAFNVRATDPFVTDQNYAVAVAQFGAGFIYPHTFTNVNGYSVNAGFLSGAGSGADRSNTNDPRIAGIYFITSATDTLRVDLSSGSAPGAGTYTIDLAAGDQATGEQEEIIVKDDTTTLITVSAATSAGHFIDATLVDRTASTTWNGATVDKTFASTTCNVVVNPASGGIFPCLAHFRLTKASVNTNITPRRA